MYNFFKNILSRLDKATIIAVLALGGVVAGKYGTEIIWSIFKAGWLYIGATFPLFVVQISALVYLLSTQNKHDVSETLEEVLFPMLVATGTLGTIIGILNGEIDHALVSTAVGLSAALIILFNKLFSNLKNQLKREVPRFEEEQVNFEEKSIYNADFIDIPNGDDFNRSDAKVNSFYDVDVS